MKIYKQGKTVSIAVDGQYYQKEINDWDALINRKGLYSLLLSEIKEWELLSDFDENAVFDAPIAGQEVWAAGVTYQRSKEARMEESKDSGGADFYDKVYDAERPELFFKATANRTVGNGDVLFIRKDSTWDVPEPELTLFISSVGTIEGYSIGNDMSSRSIEGENPLYLPQAKVFDRCAGLGPCIYITNEPISLETQIRLEILRNKKVVFEGTTLLNNLKRTFPELVDFLYRECSFPTGAFLMTGTCIVPDDDFTLAIGDEVLIHIDNIGTLKNTIGQA